MRSELINRANGLLLQHENSMNIRKIPLRKVPYDIRGRRKRISSPHSRLILKAIRGFYGGHPSRIIALLPPEAGRYEFYSQRRDRNSAASLTSRSS
ncbi:hypothetical protein EVAR_101052_1 [Eumeta japonica]|uniref:Uncharacterized protein n=1 Tax=Eumeta variegata TaxID=151549 RepID=A0A4C1SWU3_EUMVA|nr:hypothetical protein EVAR_101052_1 [Eumeta japonica]